MINVNDIAPDINISTDIDNFSLNDQKGKKIVVFFFQELIHLVVLPRNN